MIKHFFLIISIILFSFESLAETLEIEMLNKLGKETMVYSIKVARINADEKIIWRSVDKGHNVEFLGMPEGVKKFKSKINKDADYTFKIPGIYLYQCTPHKAMGMIGIVIVGGDKHNLNKVKKTKLYGKSKKVFKELLKEFMVAIKSVNESVMEKHRSAIKSKTKDGDHSLAIELDQE